MKNPSLAGRSPLIGSIEEVKFRRMVKPGDQLIHEIKILWVKGGVGKMDAQATVDGELAAKMTMLFKLSLPNKE
jgi:3-hydroxymyristoyl/3-hydroxydecanoyl-(acyl carrier protein) dehydratase